VTIYASLIAFIAAASLLTLAPGLDTALVLRTVATAGPRRAALASAGISTSPSSRSSFPRESQSLLTFCCWERFTPCWVSSGSRV
jgi:hypothetical protein